MTWASVYHHKRTIEPVESRSRARCWCGCKRRGTHVGKANGMCMTAPMCEMQARRWLRNPDDKPRARVAQREA